jgi:hypothetical protein
MSLELDLGCAVPGDFALSDAPDLHLHNCHLPALRNATLTHALLFQTDTEHDRFFS